MIYWSQEGLLVHRFEEEKIKEYYLKQHKFYSDCGIDFIKVDNQALKNAACHAISGGPIYVSDELGKSKKSDYATDFFGWQDYSTGKSRIAM